MAANPASGTSSPAAVAPRCLELIARLTEALAKAGVRYCHWKSTATLDRAEQGEGDLDLLVDRPSSQRFQEVLRRLGFKEARGARDNPGVFHAYGLDAPSGRLVHIHAHYALVLGDDMTKNYRLPIEAPYLASISQAGVFPIPAPEFELAVLVLRFTLKHAPWDAIALGLGPLSAGERHELDDLTCRVPIPAVNDCVRTHLPFVGEPLWEDCRKVLQPGASLWLRLRTAWRLEARLASHCRRPRFEDTVLKLWRRARGFLLRRLAPRRRSRLRLDSGGALIAVVGSECAGRAAADLHAWLAKDLEAVKLDLNPRSKAHSQPAHDAPHASGRKGARTLAWLAREAIDARFRYRRYVRARRLASRGALVICNGFPVRLGAGPEGLRPLEEPSGGRLVCALSRLAGRYRDGIGCPDVLIALGVDSGAAVERKRDAEDPDAARARPPEETLTEIKQRVWSSL